MTSENKLMNTPIENQQGLTESAAIQNLVFNFSKPLLAIRAVNI